MSAPPSPREIGSQANDKPRHATSLVATQQPDNALHSTVLVRRSLRSNNAVQALDDKPD